MEKEIMGLLCEATQRKKQVSVGLARAAAELAAETAVEEMQEDGLQFDIERKGKSIYLTDPFFGIEKITSFVKYDGMRRIMDLDTLEAYYKKVFRNSHTLVGWFTQMGMLSDLAKLDKRRELRLSEFKSIRKKQAERVLKGMAAVGPAAASRSKKSGKVTGKVTWGGGKKGFTGGKKK